LGRRRLIRRSGLGFEPQQSLRFNARHRGGPKHALPALIALSCARLAHAQSSGSFPEPAPAAPSPPEVPPPATPQNPAAAPPQPPSAAAAPRADSSDSALPEPSEASANARSREYADAGVERRALSAELERLPPLLPYRQGLPVPPGYRVVHRPATALTVGGGVTFLVSYAAALGLAASQSFENGTAYTAIPVAGPWAAIGARRFSCQSSVTSTNADNVQRAIKGCVGTAFDEVTTVVFLTADGLVQATGAVLFFIGLASGHDELVRADLPKAAVIPLTKGAAVTFSGVF